MVFLSLSRKRDEAKNHRIFLIAAGSKKIYDENCFNYREKCSNVFVVRSSRAVSVRLWSDAKLRLNETKHPNTRWCMTNWWQRMWTWLSFQMVNVFVFLQNSFLSPVRRSAPRSFQLCKEHSHTHTLVISRLSFHNSLYGWYLYLCRFSPVFFAFNHSPVPQAQLCFFVLQLVAVFVNISLFIVFLFIFVPFALITLYGHS